MEVEINAENIKKYFDETPGFSKFNNYHIEELSEDKAILTADISEESLNPSGIAHGGFIYGLGDTAMGTLAYLSGKKCVTVDATISYLKPCAGSKITCEAVPVKVGKTFGVYRADIYNEKKELAATLNGTYLYLDRELKK